MSPRATRAVLSRSEREGVDCMSSSVLTSIKVVNSLIENSATHPVASWIVPAGLRERIELLVARAGGSQRELSRRSGLTEVHVGQILRRLKADPDASIESTTLRAIAQGAGVSESWLLTGRGSPDDADAPELAASTRHPQIRDTPNILANVAMAKRIKPDWPEEVWEDLLDSYPRGPVEEEVLPGMLVALGELDMMFRPAKPRAETGGQPAAKVSGKRK